MILSKRLSLAATLLALTGCVGTTDPAADDYYADDFAIEKAAPRKTAPVVRKDAVRPVETRAVETASGDSDISAYANAQNSEVGKRISSIAAKLAQINDGIAKNGAAFDALKTQSAREAETYYENVAKIYARLQKGTTPGNPELTAMWKQSAQLLAGADKNMTETAKLSTEAARAKNELDSLLNTATETYMIPGALESDHENLKKVEDDARRSIISLDRLSSEIAAQITRQQQYFSAEKQNIDQLEKEIRNGGMINADRSKAAAPIALNAASALPEANLTGRRPLMVIRFNKKNVAYERSLYDAVKAALDKRPSTNFEIVAVGSGAADKAEAAKNAEAVRDTLTSMGLPEDRVFVSKTEKTGVKSTEVHLYLK